MEEKNQDLFLPEIIVVKFDETGYWRDNIREKAGGVFGYYLINRSEITRLAEINGSYYCHFLYNRVENRQNFLIGEGNKKNYLDELTEIETGADIDEPDMYIGADTKLTIVDDSYCKSHTKEELKGLMNDDKKLQSFIENAIEHYQEYPVK